MSNNITPFVKRMRTQGGTFYTFSSAIEDIGLNINEKNNIIEMSNFALLDIPHITSPDNINQNKFNVFAINGGLVNEELSNGSIKDGRIVVAESFQNYALNLESHLLNRSQYNPSLLKTVSERVFWKWLKETGAIRWVKDVNNPGYFIEEIDTDSSIAYNAVVKYFGQISAGAVRTDNHGTYNETYILVPTSHGQTRVYFNQNFDDNYLPGLRLGPGGENILGRENYTLPHPDALSLLGQYDYMTSETSLEGWSLTVNGDPGWWYTKQGIVFNDDYYYATDIANITDSSLNYTLKYDNGGETIEFQRSNVDGVELEFNITKLKDIYGDPGLTYDKIAIEESIDNSFNFNAVLVYYSIYNKTRDKKLATNLLGILFLDPASGNTSGFPDLNITIPTLTKLQSNSEGFGSSYSFRINIKSNNMLDDTQAVILDESTSSQTSLENWTDVLSSLSKSINIMNQHTSTINYITEQYMDISSIQTSQNNLLSDLQFQVNDVAIDIKGSNNTLALFADGDDPLVDSSIYMRYGKIGMFTKDPKYDLHLIGDFKSNNIVIQNSIKDSSNNLLLNYSDTLNLGSPNLAKNIKFYTGSLTNKVEIDTSGNIYVAGTVYAPSAMPSDARLKHNINPLQNSLNLISNLNGVSFEWNSNNKQSVGFIAQDVELVIPNIVEAYDPLQNGTIYKSIKYTELIPYLVEAIKEQQNMIDNLKEEINNIKK